MQLAKMSGGTFDNDILLLGNNSEEHNERRLVNFFKSESSVHSQINFTLDKRAINDSNIVAKLEENIDNQNKYYEKMRELKLLESQYKLKEREMKIREMENKEQHGKLLFQILQEAISNRNFSDAKQIAESIRIYNFSL